MCISWVSVELKKKTKKKLTENTEGNTSKEKTTVESNASKQNLNENNSCNLELAMASQGAFSLKHCLPITNLKH